MTTANNGGETPKKETTTSTTPVKTEKTIADSVLNKVREFERVGALRLPQNYSAANALKFAYLMLMQSKDKENRPVLSVCSMESVATALLDMVTQGLNPAKKQCYFIAYGNQLQMQRSYQGSIAVAKQVAGVEKVIAHPIFTEDKFEYSVDASTGIMSLVTHEQQIENIDINKLRGAYALVFLKDGTKHLYVMNMQQIRLAWQQGKGGGNTKAHQNFPDEMACKTVIGRACKHFINNSDDSALFDGDKNDPEMNKGIDTEYTVISEIKENANIEELNMETLVDEDGVVNENASEQTVSEEQKVVVEETQTKGTGKLDFA